MNDKEVMKMLADDISCIILPPISDRVRQAVRENCLKSEDKNDEIVPSEAHQRRIPTKYIFAAMLTLMAVSVPMIVVLTGTNNAPASDVTEKTVTSLSTEREEDISRVVSDVVSDIVSEVSFEVSESSEATKLEKITLKELRGDFAPSERKGEELETLLSYYTNDNKVFEDDRYIYNFDNNGGLLEIIRMAGELGEGSYASQKMITQKVDALLDEYFSDWMKDEHTIRIVNEIDVVPAWTVEVSKKKNNHLKEHILLTFDQTGCLLRLSATSAAGDVGTITKDEAVCIAIEEIKSGKYAFTYVGDDNTDIMAESKSINGQSYYMVEVEQKKQRTDDIGFSSHIMFRIKAQSGEASLIEVFS